jgi:hypothetical protein
MEFDEVQALKSASFGLGQIMDSIIPLLVALQFSSLFRRTLQESIGRLDT